MNLDESQRKKISEWVAQGLKLSEIQSRMTSELGLQMTYMQVRLLVDDLKLVPKDVEPLKPVNSPLASPAAGAGKAQAKTATAQPAAPMGAPGGVSVSVDQITRAGAVASGQVTFSDGNTATWYIDQMGRLGLAPQKAGYRPPAADVQEFQAALDAELRKMGF